MGERRDIHCGQPRQSHIEERQQGVQQSSARQPIQTPYAAGKRVSRTSRTKIARAEDHFSGNALLLKGQSGAIRGFARFDVRRQNGDTAFAHTIR